MRRWVKIPQRAAAAAGVARRRRTVGLLGGSFNPAHDGHRHISLMALKRLGLDEVWWMVSPQNPLKPAAGMAPFAAIFRRFGAVRPSRMAVADSGLWGPVRNTQRGGVARASLCDAVSLMRKRAKRQAALPARALKE